MSVSLFLPPWLSPLVSLSLCLCFCLENKTVGSIFLDSIYMHYVTFVLLFLTFSILYDNLQVHP